MSVDIGNFFLATSWILSIYGLIRGFVAALRKDQEGISSAREAVYWASFAAAAALMALIKAFVSHDYRYVYVWQTSNNEMSFFYLVSAVWGGMDGSMLLWAVFMGMFAALLLKKMSVVSSTLSAWLVPIVSGFCSFFFLIVFFMTNPFRIVPAGTVLTDGNGLNPLLQNPSMLIHPPLLYLGFTGFMVPAAFCLAALASGKLDTLWLKLTRRWTLIAWSFLTTGIILGGHWAYIELGWGGFWAWDPVENASFLPWLTGTAFLHSVMVQERRGMLKQWNVWLSVGTYMLTVFGTFLTRSGVVQSVHAFAETDIGWVFLVYIAIVASITAALVWYRRSELKSEGTITSFFSREAVFLLNNLMLLAICFATLWGVMFPIISEAVSNEKSVVGPPFFNTVNVPLFVALIFFMGVGPLIAWKRASAKVLRATFLKPFVMGSLLTIICYWLDASRPWAAATFGVSLFALLTIVAELYRGAKVRKELLSSSLLQASVDIVRKKPERYGGFIVHLGVVIIAVAITMSMAYKIERDIVLGVGERTTVGEFTIALSEIKERSTGNYQGLIARMEIFNQENKKIGELLPERRYYFRAEQATTEIAIRSTLKEDLYIAFAGVESPEEIEQGKPIRATFKVFVNPMQVWLWFGCLVMLLGTLVVLRPGQLLLAVLQPQAKSTADAEAGA